MSHLEGRIDQDAGAIADIILRPSTLAREAGIVENQEIRTKALFDTGADVSLIQAGMAERFGLVSHDIISISGIHEQVETCNVFDVDLSFCGSDIVLQNIWVAEADLASHVGVIVGRSVMRKGEFSFNGWKGTFSFRLGG